MPVDLVKDQRASTAHKLDRNRHTCETQLEDAQKSPSCQSILVTMSFLAVLTINCLHVNLSIAIIAMNNKTLMHTNPGNLTKVRLPCKTGRRMFTESVEQAGSFNWDAYTQGVVLAAVFYGFTLSQIIGVKVVRRFGGKLVLVLSIFMIGLLSIISPFLTSLFDVLALIFIRILVGIGESLAYPSLHLLHTSWLPLANRNKTVAVIYTGSHVGTIISFLLSGMLCHFVNWESVFYLTGGIAVVWSTFGIFFIFNDPSAHPRIDASERDWIDKTRSSLKNDQMNFLKVPWDDILHSLPVHATAVAHFASNWTYYTMLTCLPLFLYHILCINIINCGLLCGLSFFILWSVMVIGGLVADYLRTKQILSTTSIRKFFVILGFLLPTCCLVGVRFIDRIPALSVTLLVTAIGLSGLSMAAWSINHLDLAPPFADTLVALTSIIGTLPGLFAPLVVAALTNRNQSYEAWCNVFFVCAGIYSVATLFFCIFGSGQRQPWSIYVTYVDNNDANDNNIQCHNPFEHSRISQIADEL